MGFPVDLVTAILLRLPVKSILRFKCVAKTWCDLFQNPTFISQHRGISKRNSRLLVYYRNNDDDIGEDQLVVRLFDDQTLVSYHDLHHQFPHLLADKFALSFYIHSGLVCLCEEYLRDDIRITLWNPATRELRTLPDFNEYIPYEKNIISTDLLGFGFDPLSNDYKLIYFRRIGLWDPRNQYAAVYRVSSDSWRVLNKEEVEFLGGGLVVIPDNHNTSVNTCVNGVCYWRVLNRSLKIMILSFDLGTEVFQLVQTPLPATNGNLISLHEDRVSFWDTGRMEKNDRSYGVWVLNDEGNWTKLMNIDHVLQVERMYGFWKNGKVFVESLSGELLLYDLDTGEFRQLGIRGKGKFHVYTYAESLFAIRRD